MKHEVINGIVQVPETDYQAMLECMEMIEDCAAYDKAMMEDDELIPMDIAKRLSLGDESRMRVWREYRGLSQQSVADAAGVSKTTISEIESGRKSGSIQTLKRIAQALNVDLDDIV